MLRRALSLAGYVLFLMACAEATLQVYYRATAGQWLWSRIAIPIYQADPYSGIFNRSHLDYEHRTNEFRARYVTNAEGFRVPEPTREYARPKPPGTFRVMLVGASFAFSWGAAWADSLASQLEQGLRNARFGGADSLELLNAGVPSLAESSQLAWFEHTGRTYEPDLVVHLEYGTLLIPDTPLQHADADGFLLPGDVTPANRLRAQLKRFASVFYGFALMTRFRSTGAIQGAGRSMHAVGEFSVEASEVVASLAYFERMRSQAASLGASYAVLYYPLSFVIHEGDIARWRHLGVQSAAAHEAYDRALCDELSGRGIPCFNGTDALRRAAAESDERLYYWMDVHWTARGNAVAAEHALAAIRSLDVARQGSQDPGGTASQPRAR
jgi:hypothetical protein